MQLFEGKSDLDKKIRANEQLLLRAIFVGGSLYSDPSTGKKYDGPNRSEDIGGVITRFSIVSNSLVQGDSKDSLAAIPDNVYPLFKD